MTIYNNIGKGYSSTRKSDHRIVSAILQILKDFKISTIADIGAGTGSYAYALANHDYQIMAIEPSITMRSQAISHPKISWIDSFAESLPLPDRSVDAAIIILAMHHFKNQHQALQEACRITENGLIIIFTYDPHAISNFWLTNYFPSLAKDVQDNFIPITQLISELENITKQTINTTPFLLPNDLLDSFAAVGWGRPELYLDQKIRQGISAFAKLDKLELDQGLLHLKKDLEKGIWNQKYGYLRNQKYYDAGYIFVHTNGRLIDK